MFNYSKITPSEYESHSIEWLATHGTCPFVDTLNSLSLDDNFDRGDALISGDDPSKYIFEIQTGVAATIAGNPKQKGSITNLHFKSVLISSQLLDFSSQSNGITSRTMAMNAMTVCKYPADIFFKTLQCSIALSNHLVKQKCSLQKTDRHHTYRLSALPAYEAVADFIHEMRNRQTQQIQGHLHVIIPINRNEVANYLGLTIETVSRKFSQLKSNGLIMYDSPDRVVIKDAESFDELIQDIHATS